MRVTFKFFTVLREISGKREEEMDFPENINLEEALMRMSEKHDQRFRDYLYNEKENIRSHLQFLINNRSITNQDFKSRLKDGDKIAILPPVGGG